MTTRPSLIDWSGVVPALRDAMRVSHAPMTASQLRAALSAKKKPPVADVQALMDEDVSRGEIHRWEPAKGKAPRYWTRSPEAMAREPLLESLRTADEPLTAEQHRKRSTVDLPAPLVERLLGTLVAEGTCQRYEPLKKDQVRYWAGDPERYARRVVLGVLAKGKGKASGPMTWTELAKALKSTLKGYSEDRLSQTLQGLLDDGQVFKALDFSGRGPARYSTRPPDLLALLRESLDALSDGFAKAGVSRDEFNRAARTLLGAPSPPATHDLATEVQKTFAEIRRERHGGTGLVPIPEVRRAIAARLGPQAARHDVLDEVVKRLVKEGKLNIIPLNDATGVSVEDRNDAIPGSQETWFYLEARS